MTNRDGFPVTAYGPVSNIDVDECYSNCVESGCACTYGNLPQQFLANLSVFLIFG